MRKPTLMLDRKKVVTRTAMSANQQKPENRDKRRGLDVIIGAEPA
jgi:hypothetical protein